MVQPGSCDLLIAPPGMRDPRFQDAVLMITHDTAGGSFALCLNKTSEYCLQDIIEEVGVDLNLNFPLYWGGPVSPSTVWMLHSTDWMCEYSEELSSDWAMTSNVVMFEHMADGDYPQFFRMMFGYSSWTRGQLASELARKDSWLIATNPGPEWVLDAPIDDLWTAATCLSGKQAVASWL